MRQLLSMQKTARTPLILCLFPSPCHNPAFIIHLSFSSVSLSGNTYKHYSTAFFSFKQPSFTIRPTFMPHLWSTKHIAQKMCSIFYLSTLSPEVYAHYPQSYPHPSLSILRQKIVIHWLIHIIHKFISFGLQLYPGLTEILFLYTSDKLSYFGRKYMFFYWHFKAVPIDDSMVIPLIQRLFL